MAKKDSERARNHPQFLHVFSMEFAAMLKHCSVDDAFEGAIVEAIDCLCDADPGDLDLSEDEWQAKNWAALNGTEPD